jgi:hypothetical protein
MMVAIPPGLTPIEEQISTRAREFELGPLMRLLAEQGYRDPEQLLFESNPETVSSPALVEAVTFLPPTPDSPSSDRRVVVTLNLGLLGSNGLLPSYFLEIAEQSPEPAAFFNFVRFFDHWLLEGLLRALYPERDRAMVGDWEQVKGYYFGMMGVGSVTTLQWLFQQHFPELRVCVTRDAFRNTTESHGLRTGISLLDGTAVLGSVYESDASGFLVELHSEEELDSKGEAWAHEVQRRFTQTLLPLLAPSRLHLEVVLTVMPHASWATLSKQGYLGYERLRGSAEQGHRMAVFQGNTKDPASSRFLTVPEKPRAAAGRE